MAERRYKRKGSKGSVASTMAERTAVVTELFRGFPERKYTVKSLSVAIGAPDREGRYAVNTILEGLIEQGMVEQVGSGKFQFRACMLSKVEGVVDALTSGALYVKVDGDDMRDVFVAQRNAHNALHGDRVEVTVLRIAKNGTPEGEVISVIERSKKHFVGVLEISEHFAFVRVDSRKVPHDVYIPIDKDHEYHTGQKVLIEILDWKPGSKSPIGRILDVFGNVGDNDAEMHAILAEYNLPYKFDPEVEAAADAISEEITSAECAKRRDFRGAVTFTIDPADAKDFDDALSITKLANGWEIGVHIADVSHYVKEGDIVDTEAVNRATSVYLVDRTIPMLPEKLSNGLCSLRPNEDKLAYSAVFKMDDEANVISEWFGRTVIRSVRRFTYAEAQEIIEGAEGDYKDEILTMNRLARIMRSERFKNGAISFEREEVKFTLDESGKPLGVHFKEQKESNQLVEEFMLLANRKVASFIGKKGDSASGKTFVYRVHDKPNEDKLSSFRSFILKFGYVFKADRGKAIAKEMNKLLGTVKGRAEENVISTLAIRTMAKAIYTTDNVGHYGLAFDYYTHFTSPIRRYPDVMVHRLLDHYLEGGKSPAAEPYEALCEQSSKMELTAAEAERASIKYKMVEFMLDKLNEEFEGHISGVTEWGVYVELEETHIEGMVSLREMADDFYKFNPDDYCIEGQSFGRKITLGDRVRIKVLRADLARKQLDFEMVAIYDLESGEVVDIAQAAELNRVSKPTGQGRSKRDRGGDVPSAFGKVANKGRRSKKRRS